MSQGPATGDDALIRRTGTPPLPTPAASQICEPREEHVSACAANGPPQSAPTGPAPPAVGLRESDAWFLLGATVVITILIGVHAARVRGWGVQPIEIVRPAGEEYRLQLDINEATWVEWMQLEGLGEMLSRRIVAFREQQGRFSTVDDLTDVPGIGPKTLARIRPFLFVRPPAASADW